MTAAATVRMFAVSPAAAALTPPAAPASPLFALLP